MSDKGDDLMHKMKAKKQKTGIHEERFALAGPSNVECSSSILKLDIDCLEELFEWLSIKDLLALRRTCKRFKRAVDYYIKTNCPALGSFRLDAHNIDIFRKMELSSIELVQKLELLIGISYDEAMNASQFEAVKCVLNKLETLTIESKAISDDFYDAVLKHCHNLKKLVIMYDVDTWLNIVGSNNDWLLRQYATLEHINFQEICPRTFVDRIDEIVTFFVQNSSIRIFSTSLEFLREYAFPLNDSGVKLDELRVIEHTSPDFLDYDCLELFRELHDKGFYKKLHLSGEMFDIHMLENDLAMITPLGVERLSLNYSTFILPALPDIKEIYFDNFDEPHQFANVKNVERLHFHKLNCDQIMLAIREFPKLTLFKFHELTNDVETINLSALNREREKVTGASKVTIYVDDKIFLATKWASPKTVYSFIELKRSQTYYWEKLFKF